jgi:hypothetical protein
MTVVLPHFVRCPNEFNGVLRIAVESVARAVPTLWPNFAKWAGAIRVLQAAETLLAVAILVAPGPLAVHTDEAGAAAPVVPAEVAITALVIVTGLP